MFEMTPFRKNPGSLAKKGDYFEQLWNSFFNDDLLAPIGVLGSFANNFRVDIQETDEAFLIEADLPGVKKNSIDITYENNYLNISAKREDSADETKEYYVRRERHTGEYRRSFYIQNVDRDKIDASFGDGVLKIIIPKENKPQKTQRIPIK